MATSCSKHSRLLRGGLGFLLGGMAGGALGGAAMVALFPTPSATDFPEQPPPAALVQAMQDTQTGALQGSTSGRAKGAFIAGLLLPIVGSFAGLFIGARKPEC